MARAARGLDTDKGQSSLLSIQPFWLLFPTQPFTSQSYPCLIYVFGVLNHYAIHPLSRILEPIPFGLWCYTPISNSAISSISPLVATPLMAPNSALVFCWASATRKCRAEASSLWAERPLPKSWGSWTMTWGWSHPKMENVQVFWCVCICTQVPKNSGTVWPMATNGLTGHPIFWLAPVVSLGSGSLPGSTCAWQGSPNDTAHVHAPK